MLSSSATGKPAGGRHVARSALASGLALALAHEDEPVAVAFGAGLDLALARADEAEVPEWVQIFPAGPEIVARDGRRWTLQDPAALERAFAANGADLPFDIEHASEIKAPKGEDAPAQGWVKEIQARGDKTVWARVDWNDAGQAAIRGKRYRYVSPAFRFTKSGEIVAVTSVALTTSPALRVPALAHRDPTHTPEPKDHSSMKTLLERLREAFGLGADASEDAVVQHATSQVALARDARDPAKLVPATDLTAALARATTAEQRLAQIDTEAKEAAAVAAVDTAIAAGKIAPASRDHWLALARNDQASFDKAVEAMPAVLTPTEKAKDPKAADKDDLGLTAEQVALCREMGLEPKAYAETLKETA